MVDLLGYSAWTSLACHERLGPRRQVAARKDLAIEILERKIRAAQHEILL